MTTVSESQFHDVKLEGYEEAIKMLNPEIENEVLQKSVEDTAAHHDTISNELLQQRIYAQAESPNYRRTGAANRGRSNRKTDSKGYRRKVLNDSRLGGAETNYMPYLNRNKRIKKFNTYYWDDSVISAEQFAQRIMKFHLIKLLKQAQS